MITHFAISWAEFETARPVCETPECLAGFYCSGTCFRVNATYGLHAAMIVKKVHLSFH